MSTDWNPFEQDISQLDYMQLAEWLIACHSEILRDNYQSENDFYHNLGLFCEAWERHYEQNKKIYQSKKFAKARIFATYRNRVKLKIDYGKGRTSIESIPYDTYSNIHAIQWITNKTDALEIIEQEVSDEYQKIVDVFKPQNKSKYKILLHEVISDQAFADIEIKVRTENEKGKKVTEMTYREFLAVCEKNDTYTIKTEKHKKRSNYNAALDACGVTSTTYHDFHGERTCHRDFDKKFFINLAFALALSYQSVVKLLMYNGYTLCSEGRVFDEICKKAFRLGFSRELTIEVIKMKNAELAKSSLPFNPVSNIEKVSSGKRKKT